MTINATIKTVLCKLAILVDDHDFLEDSDILFLQDYFRRYQRLLQLKEALEQNNSIDYSENIDNELLVDLTNSVRKISKKSREAGKLIHILKKTHFKSLFNTMRELNHNEHIPQEYHGGDLHEIIFEDVKNDYIVGHVVHSEQGGFYESGESYESNQSYGSEVSEVTEYSDNMLHDNHSLPTYADIRNHDSKGYSNFSDYQVISIQKDFKQPLGITVVKTPMFIKEKNVNRCVIERILVNSLVDKQGLMQVGDIILEVNDVPVESAEELKSLLNKCKGTISFKIMKNSKRPFSNQVNTEKTYVRAFFDYDPSKDNLLPAEQIGLSFKAGDVFEVLNRDDPNFWQAVPLDYVNTQAFLIPSQSLQERVLSNSQKDLKLKSMENISMKNKRKKTKKSEIFRAKDAADIVSEADLQTYEDVVRFGPSRVPCVLLIGPTGVGKKSIKHYLAQKEPNRFAFPLQDTSEAKKSRNQPLFNHVDKNMMINDIKASQYVCLEEKGGEIYGIKASGIRELINNGKTVVLDCQPKEVYSLKTPMYNPFVILITAPGLTTLEAMQKEGLQKNLTKNKRTTAELQDIIDQSDDFLHLYKHLINAVVVNDNLQQCSSMISSLVSDYESKPSWIPASWEFDITPLPVNKSSGNRPILKHNESATATLTQRRYEKKTVKPSVSIVPNKTPPSRNSEGNSASEPDSDSNSENNLVMAKPVKYLAAKKHDSPTVKIDSNPIKHHSGLKKPDETVKKEDKPTKNSSLKRSDDSQNRKEDKPLVVRHSSSKKSEDDRSTLKQTDSRRTEDTVVKRDERLTMKTPKKAVDDAIMDTHMEVTFAKQQSQNNDNPRSTNIVSKNSTRPPPSVAAKPKTGTTQNSAVSGKHTVTTELVKDESLRRGRPDSSAPQKPKSATAAVVIDKPQKPDHRMKIVKKEASSSEMSDTSSSESDARLRENRV